MSKTVLVTGGTGALGGAVTRRLLDDGLNVAVTWIVEAERDNLQNEYADSERAPLLVKADVTDETSVTDAIAEVEKELGAIDGLVHLVGAWRGGKNVEEQSVDDWDFMHKLNLKSAFITAKGVLPSMRANNEGRIVFVSSRTAELDRAGQAAYAVAKAGVRVLAETIAEETKGTGITANVVAPSTMDTPANRSDTPNADHSRWVAPSSVAASISFLISDEAADLRGTWHSVYGSI